jgi:PAS domain S-box-containing protein
MFSSLKKPLVPSTEQPVDWDATTAGGLLTAVQSRVLVRMLRGSALVALIALLLSPPIAAAYSTWATRLALFWFISVTASWWLCETGRTSAAAVVFVALTWFTFTLPGMVTGERFSEGNIVASLVIAALLLPWPAAATLGLCSMAAAGASVALDASAYALPVILPSSNFLRLAATLLETYLVVIALWLTATELRSAWATKSMKVRKSGEVEERRLNGEDPYRTLFARSPNAWLVLDDGRFIDCNAAAIELFGAAREQILGCHPAEWSPEIQADGERSLDKAARLIEQTHRDGTARFEWTHLRADGTTMETEVVLTTLRLKCRTVLCATVRDVTERLRAQEALRVSEAQLLANLQNAPKLAIQWYDKQGRVLFWNNASEVMYGWKSEQAIGKTVDALMCTSEEATQFRNQLEEVAKTGQSSGLHEKSIRRSDGSAGWMLATMFPISMGNNESGYVCMGLDITARILAERKVVESERRYRSLFECAMDCILVIDPAARLVDLNHQVSATLGYSREELLGESFTRVLGAHMLSRLYPRPVDIAVERRSVRGEQEVRAKDGTVRVVEFVASPLPDGNVLAVVRDVTERKRAADAIRTLNEDLERRVADQTAALREANRELESFSYSVSHDLRAPLRAINGFAAILREDHGAVLTGKPMQHLECIERNVLRMERLIDDLLAFSCAALGVPKRSDVDMRPIVAAAIEEHRAQWGGRATIEIGPLPLASGDPALLRQVWSNLVCNAMKYSSKQWAPQIRIGGAEMGERTEFWITDNGAGFDMAQADKLFGVFQRLHSPSEFEGTGIGLAIVQRIVHRHGGTVRAEGRKGSGATFYFTLPARLSAADESPGAGEHARANT